MSGANGGPILCLVGAGVNPDLLTSVLTTDLLEWDGFRDPTGLAVPAYGAVGFGADDQRTPFFKWLVRSIELETGKPDDRNFEDLIHLLELVASHGYVDLDRRWVASDYGAGLLALNACGMAVASANPKYIAERACYHILRRVVERTRDVTGLDAAILLQRLHENGHRLRVFSLNYDALIMERLPSPPWTGFDPAVASEARFLLQTNPPDDRDLHIQLHGSTNFGLAATDFDHVTRIRRWDDTSGSSASWDITTGSARDRYLDGHAAPAVPMITGRRKADRILTEPFASYFHYLRRSAFATPDWLIMGYGGADPHVNSILESARRHHGPRLRAAICNWLPRNEIDDSRWASLDFGSPFHERVFGLTGFSAPFVEEGEFHRRRRFSAPLRCINRDDANVLSSEVIATVNGRYEEHVAKLEYWFGRRR